MTELPTHILRLADLSSRKATRAVLEPDAAARAAIAAELGIPQVRKFRFEAELAPRGRSDWDLSGQLGATVVQDCVVTLAPVTSRIDEAVTRRYVADYDQPAGGTELEMPEDDTAEPKPETLDLYAVAIEALALALPPYPRADGAEVTGAVFAEPGVTPMTDDDARPFAGLSALRDRLGQDAEDGQQGDSGDATGEPRNGDRGEGGPKEQK